MHSKEFHEGELDQRETQWRMAGHFGRDKTIAILREHYFWPQMSQDVKNFVQNCQVCQVAKGFSHNTGLYQPLPIPSKPSEDKTMDFVLGLLRKKRSNDLLFLVVDRVSKIVHFISCYKSLDVVHIANLFFTEVVRLHGLPNRDTKFVGYF